MHAMPSSRATGSWNAGVRPSGQCTASRVSGSSYNIHNVCIRFLACNSHTMEMLYHILDAPQKTRPPRLVWHDGPWGTCLIHEAWRTTQSRAVCHIDIHNVPAKRTTKSCALCAFHGPLAILPGNIPILQERLHSWNRNCLQESGATSVPWERKLLEPKWLRISIYICIYIYICMYV